jgi:hypothetical protein
MPESSSLAKIAMILGVVIFAIGAMLWLISKMGLPLGKLPGDLRIERGNLTCVIPLLSSLILSLLLTIALNIILRLINK